LGDGGRASDRVEWGEGAGTEREEVLLPEEGVKHKQGEGVTPSTNAAAGGWSGAGLAEGVVLSSDRSSNNPVVTYKVKEVMPGEGGGMSSEEEAYREENGECMSSTCEMSEEWWMEGEEEVECGWKL
jgi:hypothetical protein